MENKELKEKAIDIKGKEYVMVKDRIVYFNEKYPKGSIHTEILTPLESNLIVIRAKVFPDTDNRYFVGHSQAIIGDGYINKTAALENAETSAVGRALAMMGIGVIDSVASADEMRKAETNTTSVNSTSKVDYVQKIQESKKSMDKNVGEPCKNCQDGVYVLSKAGKVYCDKKCWLTEKSDEDTKDGYNSHLDLTREQQEQIPF